MPRSMTGYGAAQAAGRRISVEAEIRSVNSRSFKLVLRSPALLSPKEADLELLVRRRVRRGALTLRLKVAYLRPADALRVREEVVEGFSKALDQLRRRGLVEGPLSPEALAALHGAVEVGPEDPLRPADWKVVRQAVEEALEALDAMRRREADHLVRSLRPILRRMSKGLAAIEKRSPAVAREYGRRLSERVQGLLQDQGLGLDDATLAREVALFADRCDVTEETTRLAAHIEEFGGYLDGNGDVGRTLDFLTQEMLREANTIGSKNQDVSIARLVIALKSDIDRLKEQVANLE